MWKGVYSNEYMDDWEKFNGTLIPEKKHPYGPLNIENTTDAIYKCIKRVCKDFDLKKLGECNDFYV